jgi:hypothetical protein
LQNSKFFAKYITGLHTLLAANFALEQKTEKDNKELTSPVKELYLI